MLDGIQDAGRRAADIVHKMLRFSRRNDKGIEFEDCDLSVLLDDTLDLVASDNNLKDYFDFKNIRIETSYDKDLPCVVCDRTEIQQVFFNLLKNGAEAMSLKAYTGDEPRFRLSTWREGDWAVIEIEDNGPGMPENVRKRVFEPFFTTKEVGRGTGLGMSVSYFIVTDQHGGEMQVHSQENKGTRFVVKLPLRV